MSTSTSTSTPNGLRSGNLVGSEGNTTQGKSPPMDPQDFTTAALRFAAKLLPVFPCGLDKKPLTLHGFKDASIDPAATTTDHLVLDIETLGTTPGCEIRSIGAAYVTYGIDLEDASFSGGHYLADRRSFYRMTDNSTLYRGTVNQDTWHFWHSRKASRRSFRHAFTHPDRIPIDEALAHLAKHIASLRQAGRDLMLWGNGPEFDMSILEYAYRTTGQAVPWQYWEVRDIRTATSLHPVTLRRRTTKHHALMDAEHEGKMLAMVLNSIRHPIQLVKITVAGPIGATSDHQSER